MSNVTISDWSSDEFDDLRYTRRFRFDEHAKYLVMATFEGGNIGQEGSGSLTTFDRGIQWSKQPPDSHQGWHVTFECDDKESLSSPNILRYRDGLAEQLQVLSILNSRKVS